MIDDLLKSVREVRACEKCQRDALSVGSTSRCVTVALYNPDCTACLRLVLAHCRAQASPAGGGMIKDGGDYAKECEFEMKHNSNARMDEATSRQACKTHGGASLETCLENRLEIAEERLAAAEKRAEENHGTCGQVVAVFKSRLEEAQKRIAENAETHAAELAKAETAKANLRGALDAAAEGHAALEKRLADAEKDAAALASSLRVVWCAHLQGSHAIGDASSYAAQCPICSSARASLAVYDKRMSQ